MSTLLDLFKVLEKKLKKKNLCNKKELKQKEKKNNFIAYTINQESKKKTFFCLRLKTSRIIQLKKKQSFGTEINGWFKLMNKQIWK